MKEIRIALASMWVGLTFIFACLSAILFIDHNIEMAYRYMTLFAINSIIVFMGSLVISNIDEK